MILRSTREAQLQLGVSPMLTQCHLTHPLSQGRQDVMQPKNLRIEGVKERPILFFAPMVLSALDGTKNQTRRVVKGAPEDWDPVGPEFFSPTVIDRNGEEQPGPECFGAGSEDGHCWIRCPYGAPGDRLWVRETFFAFGRWVKRFNAKKGRDEWHFVDMTLETGRTYDYAATAAPKGYVKVSGRQRAGATPSWWKRPAIFMPREASRITLEVTGVRVERLQDISRGDAMAEGCPFPNMAAGPDPRQWYVDLWKQINGVGSWDANPWVWVVSFRRLEQGL